MNEADIAGIADWIVQRGLAGDDEITLLHGFCDRCVTAELAITRGIAIIDTLYPVYEGRVFYWSGDKPPETLISQYEPSTGSQDSGWLNSPFYDLLQSGEDEMRRRLHLGETADFSVLEELRLEGQTDWLAMVQRFDKEAAIGEMDCFMSRWTRRAQAALPMPMWRRSVAWSLCSDWRSSRYRLRASRSRWSKPISGEMPAGVCLQARYRAARPNASTPSSGFPTCRVTRRCRSASNPTNFSRCSTIIPRSPSPPCMQRVAMFSS